MGLSQGVVFWWVRHLLGWRLIGECSCQLRVRQDSWCRRLLAWHFRCGQCCNEAGDCIGGHQSICQESLHETDHPVTEAA